MNLVRTPFPHVVADGLWDQSLLDAVLAEVPGEDHPSWRRFGGANEFGKLEGSDSGMWGPQTNRLLAYLRSPEWCERLSETFGIPNLTADTLGGGYHQIVTGGLLAMHVDFNRAGSLHRRLNCLIYLNRDWRPEYGGALVLGQHSDLSVAPVMNRTVIFATSEESWHGHPEPWAGPEPRRSVAIYYYSPEPAPNTFTEHSTVWLAA